MKYIIKEILHFAQKLIFPNRCVICDTTMDFNKNADLNLCDECRKDFDFIGKIHCIKCGAKLYDKSKAYCSKCEEKLKNEKTYYEYGLGLVRYNDSIKESIHRLKYSHRAEYGEFYGKLLAKYFKNEIIKMNLDCFVSVPIHKNRYIKRGYNQSEIIAKNLSTFLNKKYSINIPYNSNLLKRNFDTKVLNKMSPEERAYSLSNAFYSINNTNIKNVCIIDDIYTTGATIENCAKALKASGVKNVFFLTIAVVDNF